METKNIYSIPVKESDLGLVISDKRAHNKDYWEHAIDFVLPEGTELLAAEDGIVLEVKDDSSKGGLEEKYDDEKYLNFIKIKHENNEVSEYSHVKHKGALVKKGDRVEKGQVIGLSGNTGYSSEPHLHFHVVEFDNQIKTLEIKFNKELKVIRGPPYDLNDTK